MGIDYAVYWTGILGKLKETLTETEMEVWINQLQYFSFDEKKLLLTLSAPTDFIKSFVINSYSKILQSVLFECWNQNITLCVITQNEKHTPVVIDNKKEITPIKNVPKTVQKPIEEIAITTVTEIIPAKKEEGTIIIPENEECTFDSFITDHTNEYPFRLAQAIAEEPGNPKRNPFFLWGESGTGKTHLIKAIKQRAGELFPKKKIKYVTSEVFSNEFLDSLKEKSSKEFREKYRCLDIFLLDDFQFFQGKDACLNELFNTFNELYDHKTQMVFTCDQPISKMASVEKRIKSRFSMGTTVELKQPDYELKMAILKELAQQNEMQIDIKNIEYICTNISGNIREIRGAFFDLLSYASLMNKKEITPEIIQECLRDKITTTKSSVNISIDRIMEKVATYYDLTALDIRGKKRTQSIALARQIAMYLSAKYTRQSTTQIGKYFNKEHATIIHASRKIEKSIQDDKKLKAEVINIENRIKEEG